MSSTSFVSLLTTNDGKRTERHLTILTSRKPHGRGRALSFLDLGAWA
jgi:hypothetical protein